MAMLIFFFGSAGPAETVSALTSDDNTKLDFEKHLPEE
jgi:hypothetical protein